MSNETRDTLGSRIKGTAPVRALGRRAVAALDERERRAPPPARASCAWALSRVRLRAGELDTPLLGLHGTADGLTSPRGTAELIRRARTPDRTLLLYKGLYHDLVHEPERDQVMGDIERWLERRVARAQSVGRRRPSEGWSAAWPGAARSAGERRCVAERSWSAGGGRHPRGRAQSVGRRAGPAWPDGV
jgi:hypothetical protein